MVMGTELAPGIVCCASLCGSLGVPHHVTPWEQHRTGGDLAKQSFKIRSLAKDKAMENSKLRIVQCPKCRAYLQEPPPGNPFYECGSCFTTLQAKHATQEDVERRLQQKALLKRMEIDKNTKSVSSEDGCKVFTSESSSEKSNDREEHAHSGEGSPTWSPSRWESPLYGSKSGHSSQQQPQPQPQPQHQRQAVESSEKPQYHSQGGAPRAKQDVPQDKVEALAHNLHRLAVEDNDEMQYSNRTSPRSPSSEWVNGHGAQHLSMRRSRPEELQHQNDGEGNHSQVHQVQKSVSFNDAANKHSGELNKHSGELSRHSGELGRHSGELNKHSGEVNKHSGELDRLPTFSKDVHQASRMVPSGPEETVEDSIHHLLDDFLSARYDERPHYLKVEGYEVQRDMYAATDVTEYGTSSRTSSVGDGDSHHVAVAENQSRPLSGELDSYVVLDHRVTRPGSYQRSSSASRQGQLNTTYHLPFDGHERYHSDGERSSHTPSASKMQHRPASYHVQQSSHAPHQSSAHSPPHYAYNKPPAGQNYPGSLEPNSQSGATKSYPFLPRLDEAPYVHCQHCEQLLGVPANLPPTKKSYQKLRCGACMKISVFLIATEEHVSAPAVSPKGHGPFTEFSTAHAPHVSSPSDLVSRHVSHGVRADSDTGDRGHPPIVSGGSPRLPPMARNIPRIPSGSKLSAMTSATNGTSMMGHASVSNGVSNLHPATGTIPARSSSSSHYGDGTSYRRSHSAYGPNGEHVMSSLGPRASAGSDYEGHHPHDGRLFQTSSESDNDSPRMRPPMSSFKGEQFHASSRMPLDRHVAQQYSKDEGYMQEANMASSMSLKGIIKKGVKELTKTKQTSSNNLFRRKVTVNGSPISDALLKRAEGLAGPIYPGSYWYDSQAGFWGISGGPCFGIIPPHIEELSLQPVSRNCSGGQTGVVVNGRELHKSDYDLLVRRGLPPTPGKQYFVDIEGRVKEAVSGYELRGLGPLAPTLDQTGRGLGMWIPGSSEVA